MNRWVTHIAPVALIALAAHVVSLAAAPAPGSAGAAGLVLRVRDHAVIRSAEIRLADVADAEPSGELPAALASIIVGTAGGGGAALRIDAACVRNQLLRAGLLNSVAEIAGGPCMVERAGQRLDAAVLREAAERAAREWMLGVGDSIAILVGEPAPAWMPGGPSTCSIDVPDGVAGPGIMTFFANVQIDGRRMARIPLRVTITVYRPAPVAIRTIQRHETLTAADVRWQRTAVRQRGVDLPATSEEIDGWRATRVIREGELIDRRCLESDPVVHRGDDVSVSLCAGELDVSLVGRALDDGARGETIRVRNPLNGRMLRALVIAPGRARLTSRSDR